MSKTKKVQREVPIEIYPQVIGAIQTMVESFKIEQAARERMQQQVGEARQA